MNFKVLPQESDFMQKHLVNSDKLAPGMGT